MVSQRKQTSFYSFKVDKKLIIITILFLIGFAVLNTFIQDDAFITFRYAENLVQNHDLTWNAGEQPRVEGYTNFLWTILMTLPIALNWDPIVSSQMMGLLCAFGTFIFFYKLALLITKSPLVSWLSLILVGTNYSFSAYATGGLETSLQVFLITLGVSLVLEIWDAEQMDQRKLGMLSFICALSLLTRLDSALPFAILFLVIFWRITKESTSVKKSMPYLLPLILPVFLMVSFWLIWKIFYYGDILPNSFYVKASHFSFEIIKRGLFYIYAFVCSYFLIPIVFIAVLFLKRIWSKPKDRVLLFIVAIWCLYIIRVGGDFMEFRFIMPVLPLAFIVASSLFSSFKPWTFIAFFILVFAGSVNHYFTFTHYYEIEPISALNGHIVNPNEDWIGIGQALKVTFYDAEKPVVIATRAAGAIPYYSKLTTIDMLGLNDRLIARHGVFGTSRPGHQKRATLDYLLDRETHLVIGHPKLIPIKAPLKNAYSFQDLLDFGIYQMKPEKIPLNAKVIIFQVNPEYKLPILYLYQHALIDTLIDHQKFNTIPIHLK